MSQYQFQLAGREMCLLAETTSLYLLSRPSQKKKRSANDFQASLLNSPSSCTSSCMPTETANQNVTLLHFSLSASSLFIHFPIYFLPSSWALAQVDIPSCHSRLSWLFSPSSSVCILVGNTFNLCCYFQSTRSSWKKLLYFCSDSAKDKETVWFEMIFLIDAPNKLAEVLHWVQQYEEKERREQLVTTSVNGLRLFHLS